jgi:hypothetical protein
MEMVVIETLRVGNFQWYVWFMLVYHILLNGH